MMLLKESGFQTLIHCLKLLDFLMRKFKSDTYESISLQSEEFRYKKRRPKFERRF